MSVEAIRAPSSPRQTSSAYMAAVGCSVAGSAAGFLGATGTTNAAGNPGNGAVYTGIYVSAVLLTSALVIPYAPTLSHRLGARSLFIKCKAVTAVVWLAVGFLLLAGVPGMPLLLVLSPVLGALSGLGSVVSPVMNKAYLAAPGMAAAFARMAVISGFAWGIGSLAGGLLLDVAPLGWGLIANGLLTIPLAVIVSRFSPLAALSDPIERGRPWHDVWASLRGSEALRRVTLMACVVALCIAPLALLIVPITEDLRHQPLLVGSGLLMAAMALGEAFSPKLVRRLSIRHADLPSSALTAIGAGVVLILFGISSVLLSGPVELGVWALISVGFGVFRFASRAFTIGATAESRAPELTASSLASMMLVAGLFTPLGTFVWSLLIGYFSASTAVLCGGAAMLVIGIPILISTQSANSRNSATGAAAE
ncbi:MAG: MFS transporter [Actinomycetes bacterium]